MLSSCKPEKYRVIKLINEILLFWAQRDSYGIPVGSNASRILAEAALIDVDNFLVSHGVSFCRFVDDFRFFVKNVHDAHIQLSMLVEKLSKDGLFINISKTDIRDVSIKSISPNLKEPPAKNGLDLEDGVVDETNNNKIISGYSGIIPLKFRKISQKEQLIIKSTVDIEEVVEPLLLKVTIKPEDVTNFFKAVSAFERFDLLANAPTILAKFPQFLPYATDFINKNLACINNELVNKIKSELGVWFDIENLNEYIHIYLVRLFDPESAKDKRKLFDFFRKIKRNSGDYIGRVVLEALASSGLTRSEVLEIRGYYKRADIWERRQILKIVAEGLPPEESAAFFRNIKINGTDIFSKQIIKGVGTAG